MSRSHRQRRWPLLRLQTAEISSQLQDYYLALVGVGGGGGCIACQGSLLHEGKMNQRLVGGEVDSVHARFPVGLNKSRQTLAPTQTPLQKGSRIASGNRGTSFILLPNFYVNLSYYAQTDVEKMGPDVTLRAGFFFAFI